MKESATQVESGGLMRPAAAAKYLGVGQSTFWALAKKHAEVLRLIRLGARTTCVRKSDLDAFITLRESA